MLTVYDLEEAYEFGMSELAKYLEVDYPTASGLERDLQWMRIGMEGKGFLSPPLLKSYHGNPSESATELQNCVREHAMNLESFLLSVSVSYSVLADFEYYFRKLGEAYGLLKEFEENALC